MKKKKIVICIIIMLIIISIIVGILLLNSNIFNLDSNSLNMNEEQRIKKGYDILGYDYCKTHPLHGWAGTAETPWTCKICGYSDINSNTDAPTLCTECATITGRCSKCGKIKSEEQIETEQLKSKLYSKSNKINVAADKLAYIKETDNIAFLAPNYDSDKKAYPNKIVITNMKDYSEIDTIKLTNDYSLEYSSNYDWLFNNAEEINEETLGSFLQNFQQEEISKYQYEKQGSFFYEDGFLILINPQKEKSFIYDLEEKKLIEEFEWDTGEYDNKTYIHINNKYNQKDYYYFEEYDLINTSINDIDFTKYYSDPYTFISKDCYDAQIVYQNGKYVLIAYYEKEYGDIKLNLYNSNKKQLNLQQINSEEIVVSNKYLVMKYNIKEGKEIWSYDLNVIDKAYEMNYKK